MDKLLYEKRDRIAYLTINRPEARNAIDPDVHAAMIEAWADFAEDGSLDVAILWGFGALAIASLVAYLAYTVRCRGCVHPGERWLVVANALAFGSAYVLGAWTVSFILVLALHHEVQYLYFTYAMARRSSVERLPDRRAELQLIASFAVWPIIGLASWAACKFSDLPWLAPFLVGGLLCHYWLDSRIWTARARRLALR